MFRRESRDRRNASLGAAGPEPRHHDLGPLLRPIKRRLPLLAGVAALLLMMRAVELAWWISPGRSLVHLWIDPLIVLGLGAAWFGYFWFALARTPTEVADV